jgi:beta-galactosidase
MKQIFLLFAIYLCFLPAQAQNSRSILFDKDWRFKKDSSIHTESASFDDAAWRKLELPHNGIEDLPNQTKDTIVGRFSKASIVKMISPYMIGGTARYWKHFTLYKTDERKTASL